VTDLYFVIIDDGAEKMQIAFQEAQRDGRNENAKANDRCKERNA
jgi:hypothetical protein